MNRSEKPSGSAGAKYSVKWHCMANTLRACAFVFLYCAFLSACGPVPNASAEPTAAPVILMPTQTPAAMSVPEETARPVSAQIRIVQAILRNCTLLQDSYGEYSDFVDVANTGKETLSLSGWFLSDDPEKLDKWSFPAVSLAPGQELTVFLSGRGTVSGECHTSFSVSREEGLYLTGPCDEIQCISAMGAEKDIALVPDAQGRLHRYWHVVPGTAPVLRSDAEGVYISEVSALGEDWIELGNSAETAVSLQGMMLNTAPSATGALALQQNIAAGGYAVSAELPFNISSGGETLYLLSEDGEILDSLDTGALRAGCTCGRKEKGGERLFYQKPTKGEKNQAGYIGYAQLPILSEISLYHTDPFTVTVKGRGELRYTLDGSEPGADSSLYTEPLLIRQNTVLRVRAFEADRLPSDTASATYLFDAPHSVPIVTFIMDPDEWQRLRVNKKEDIEIPSQVAYYDKDGHYEVGFPAGVAVRGNGSRNYRSKSFAVHLRSRYGQGSVCYPFWGEGTARNYSNLTLRNGSQDARSARIRDSFCCRAALGLNVDVTMTRPTVLYVNGEYYLLEDLNEGMSASYFTTHYGVDKDKVNIIEWNDKVRRGSGDGLAALRAFVKTHDLSDDAVFAEYAKMADIDAFTDYLILQTFFCSRDFHNQLYVGTDDGSLLYRPVFYDLDVALMAGKSEVNSVGNYLSGPDLYYGSANRYVDVGLYACLRKNRAWVNTFLDRYAYLLCTGLSVESLQKLLDEMTEELRPEIPGLLEVAYSANGPGSFENWERQIALLRKEIPLRHKAIQKILQREFRINAADWKALMAKYGG